MRKFLTLSTSLILASSMLFGLSGCSIEFIDEDEITEVSVVSEETTSEEEETTIEATTSATTGATTETTIETTAFSEVIETELTIDEDGTYTTMEDVALYIHIYGTLPHNFITKNEARSLGWEGGSLEPYAPGMCIGGDYFGNYEGLLPEAPGREYHECDINTLGARSRGAERIIFSNDGLIYYTGDHYESFTLLYGEV